MESVSTLKRRKHTHPAKYLLYQNVCECGAISVEPQFRIVDGDLSLPYIQTVVLK